jgi:CHAT domain-containing protein
MKISPILLGILLGFCLPNEFILLAQEAKDYKGWRILFEEVEGKMYADSLAQGIALMDSLEKIVKEREDSDGVDGFQLDYLRNLYRWRLGQENKWSIQRREYLFSVMGNTHREELLKAKFLFLEGMYQWQEGLSFFVIQNTLSASTSLLEKYPDRTSQLLLARIYESQSDVANEFGIYEYALEPLQRALDICEVYHTNNQKFLGNLYNKIALTYESNGLSRQSYEAFEKSIHLFEKQGSEMDRNQLDAYRGYWHSLWIRADYEALRLSLDMFEKRSAGAIIDSSYMGYFHLFRSVWAMNQGDFVEGQLQYKEILALLDKGNIIELLPLMEILLTYASELLSYGSNQMDPLVLDDLENLLNDFLNREEFTFQWEKYYSLVLRYHLEENNLEEIENYLDLYQALLSHIASNKKLYNARFWAFQAMHHLQQQNFGKAKNFYHRALESWGDPLAQGLGPIFVEDRALLMDIYCSLGEISVKMLAQTGDFAQLKEAEDLISLCRSLLSELSLFGYTRAERVANCTFALRVGELLFELEELKEIIDYANLQGYLFEYNKILRSEYSSNFIQSPLYDSVCIYRQILIRNAHISDLDSRKEQMELIVEEIERGGYLGNARVDSHLAWEEIGSLLPGQTDLLQYFWGHRKIYILQTKASGFRLYGIRKGLDCDTKAREWAQMLQQNQMPDKISDWAFPLYKQLFFPLKQVSENVWVIPDGPLLDFPLETLMDEESKEGFFPYLIYKYKICYLSSLDPLLENAQSSYFHSSFFGIYNGGEEMIKLIGGIFPVSKVFSEKSIGLSRFFSYLEEHNVVHLSKGFAMRYIDSRKTSLDNLAKEPKKVDLLVVENQWNPRHPHGKVLFENRALNYIHSLWEGGMLSHKLLFLDFYKRIALGQEIGHSFREAQLDLIEMHSLDKPFAWPYYWATYRLYGMPGRLPALRQDPWRSALPAGIIFALILTIFVFFKYGRRTS